jgi:hypothetical protein
MKTTPFQYNNITMFEMRKLVIDNILVLLSIYINILFTCRLIIDDRENCNKKRRFD